MQTEQEGPHMAQDVLYLTLTKEESKREAGNTEQ